MIKEYYLKENYLMKYGWVFCEEDFSWRKPTGYKSDTYYIFYTVEEAFKLQEEWNSNEGNHRR